MISLKVSGTVPIVLVEFLIVSPHGPGDFHRGLQCLIESLSKRGVFREKKPQGKRPRGIPRRAGRQGSCSKSTGVHLSRKGNVQVGGSLSEAPKEDAFVPHEGIAMVNYNTLII